MKYFYVILISCCALCNAQEPPLRLTFGVYPSERATVIYRKFSPIIDEIRAPIESQLGREVDIHLTIFKDYESGITALAKGEVDFVRFGPSSYILAEQRNPDIQLLAMELRKGMKRFNGLIIAHKDSNITNIKDIKGKSFAFGNENSTIGRFLSQALLLENGINAESLQSYEFLERHDEVAKAIMTKTHDVGALKDSTYKKLCDPKEVTIVSVFSNVTKPWVASSTLSKEIREAITASLLILEDKEIIGELGCSGFAMTTPEEYDLVRLGMEKAKSFVPKIEEDIKAED